jgi:hypothetical protein
MPRPQFTLTVDGTVPMDHDPPTSPGRVIPFPDSSDLFDAMKRGQVKIFGFITSDYPGSPTEAGYEPLTGNCIIVYIGGTAYKICS